MSLFGLGKKKEEVKIEPACACNGEVATYEASSCCCGGQQVDNCWLASYFGFNICITNRSYLIKSFAHSVDSSAAHGSDCSYFLYCLFSVKDIWNVT